MAAKEEFIVHDSNDRFKDLIAQIEARYTSGGYVFGQKSNYNNSKDFGHWSVPVLNNGPHFKYDLASVPGLLDKHPEVREAWDYITTVLGHRRSLFRVYFNGYTFGADGTLHYDDPWIAEAFGWDVPSETCVVYLNETWDKNWAGETVVFDKEEQEIVKSVMPKHGRIFIFDSLRLHGARPVTRVCPVLRRVLVFKTGFPEMNSNEIDYLRINLGDRMYKGESMFTHLYQSMRIAEDRGASKKVCAAVLYSNVYGVQSPEDRGPFTREMVRDVIGSDAEMIVYTYHTTLLSSLLYSEVGDLNLTPRMVLDVLSVYFAVLLQQNAEGEYTELLEQVADRIDSIAG